MFFRYVLFVSLLLIITFKFSSFLLDNKENKPVVDIDNYDILNSKTLEKNVTNAIENTNKDINGYEYIEHGSYYKNSINIVENDVESGFSQEKKNDINIDESEIDIEENHIEHDDVEIGLDTDKSHYDSIDEYQEGVDNGITYTGYVFRDNYLIIDDDNNVIISGLVYENRPFDKTYTFCDAKKRCEELQLSGKIWRMPTAEELKNTISSRKNKGKDGEFYIFNVFVNNLVKPASFWSESKNIHGNNEHSIGIIDFTSGNYIPYYEQNKNKHYILCVSDEQS